MEKKVSGLTPKFGNKVDVIHYKVHGIFYNGNSVSFWNAGKL